ncbi:MAG: hypothetical protein ACRDVG_09135, partial [Jatrophihabitantaceae bacterium]
FDESPMFSGETNAEATRGGAPRLGRRARRDARSPARPDERVEQIPTEQVESETQRIRSPDV